MIRIVAASLIVLSTAPVVVLMAASACLSPRLWLLFYGVGIGWAHFSSQIAIAILRRRKAPAKPPDRPPQWNGREYIARRDPRTGVWQ